MGGGSLDNPVLLSCWRPLPHACGQLAPSCLGVRHHVDASGAGIHVLLVLHAKMVGRALPAHLCDLRCLRVGSAADKVPDLAPLLLSLCGLTWAHLQHTSASDI